MNTSKSPVRTPARVTALAAGTAMLIAGNALAGLTYGDGITKPVTVREMRAEAWVLGEGSAGNSWSQTGIADMEFKWEVELYHADNWPMPSARAYSFQQSRLHADRMNFLLNAGAGARPHQMFGDAFAHARIDTWVYTSEAMPYWLVLAGSRALISITREDGSDTGILSKDTDGAWLDASGALDAGWYHIQMSVERSAWGASAAGQISGQFGIPAPGALALLALSGVCAAARRRD